MNRSELRARLRTLSGVLMDTLLTDVEANSYLNEAYLAICSLAEWSFSYTEASVPTVAGQGVYALPAGVERVQDVLVGQVALQRRTVVDLDRYPTFRRTRAPWAWAPLGDTDVRVFPPPASAGSTVTVRGWASPALLSADTSVPVFEDEFHPVIAYEAAANVLEAEGDDSGRSVVYRGEVGAYLDRMARRYLPDGGQVAYPNAEQRVEAPEGDE